MRNIARATIFVVLTAACALFVTAQETPAAPAPPPAEPATPAAPAEPPAAPTPVPSTPAAHQTFLRVFGDAIALDPVMSAQVLKDTPGKRHYVDMNVDGKPEEGWFVDINLRHADATRPLLVRAIDEDGDLAEGDEPDQDSDLYIADWNGNGSIDAVMDYVDRDADQDIAELVLYRAGGPLANGDESVMTVWWSRDLGDDNLLWLDAGYGPDLATMQWRSHFGGNEMHSGFILPPDATAWKPAGDTPFFFFDRDGDLMSEENLRFDSEGLVLRTMRHSMDADNDQTFDSQHD